SLDRPVEIVGPERIRLTGPNGAGKSTLLAAIMAASGAPMRPAPPIDELYGSLAIRVSVPFAHLDQQYRLPEALTVMEAIRSGNPHLGPHRVHEVLAAMGLRGRRTEQRCATLSGGERFRVALAAWLLREPAPQLRILDEPGNIPVLSSPAALVSGLEGFDGAMIVTTPAVPLAAALGAETEWDVREFLRAEAVGRSTCALRSPAANGEGKGCG